MEENPPSIHLGRGGRRHGPYPTETVREMVRRGEVAPGDLAWHAGMENWRRAGDLPELAGAWPSASGGAGGTSSRGLSAGAVSLAAGLLLLLAVFWWWAREYMVPGYTGLFNDDGVYFTSARALAEGRGYIVAWLNPPIPADRFPIGYPAWLALFWTFPLALLETRVLLAQHANILLAMGFLAVTFFYAYRVLGLPAWACLAGIGLAGLSPFCLYYTPTLMSDLPAAFWLSLSLLFVTRYAEKSSPGNLALAAVTAAVAILFRYAAGVLPLVAIGFMVLHRRFKPAAAYAGATGLLLAPWIWWVVQGRAFGYAGQIAHQTYGDWTMRFLSLAFSGGFMFVQGLPSFLWERLFLPSFPMRSPTPFFNPYYLMLGLAFSAIILAGVALSARREALRLPVAFVLGTLALIVVWQTGFLNLGEHLTIRLMLGVAPLLLILSFVGWADGLREAHTAVRAVALLGLGAVLLINGAAAYTLRLRMINAAVPAMVADRQRIHGLVREFARQVPEELQAASNFEPLFHLITGRSVSGASPNPKWLAAQIISNPKLGFLVMTPSPVGTRDLTLEAVKTLNKRFPGLVYTIYDPDGEPTGVFRLDRGAIDRAPVLD